MLRRYFYLFFSSLLLNVLSGCSSNAHFDDAEYRSVGQTKPLNGVINNPNQAPLTPKAPSHYEADGYANTDGITNTSTMGLRYGHSLTIRKIIQTVRIHCSSQPLPNSKKRSPSQTDSEPLQFCHYQFPDACGSHRFSLIENTHQTALIYHDLSSQRNILDQVHDTEYAEPGLWDLADQVSVSSPYPEQQIYYQFSGDASQAWVVGINEKDRAKYGTQYAKAINETLGCF